MNKTINKISLNLCNEAKSQGLPSTDVFVSWINSTFDYIYNVLDKKIFDLLSNKNIEVSICFISKPQMQEINNSYRKKNYPTNILTFATLDTILDDNEQSSMINLNPEILEDINPHDFYLGDLLICLPIIKKEAKEQDKPIDAHLAHIVIHGILHCCGYDHIDDEEAEIMETLEKYILKSIGF